MAYTLPDANDVIALTGSTLPEAVIDAMIVTAEQIALPCIADIDDDKANVILLWLSAHLVASVSADTYGNLTARSLGDSSKSWSRAATGEGLKGTTYGQQVLLLDTCGCFYRLGKGAATLEII